MTEETKPKAAEMRVTAILTWTNIDPVELAALVAHLEEMKKTSGAEYNLNVVPMDNGNASIR